MIKKILKWAGIVVSSLVTLIVLFFVVAYFISESRFNKKREIAGHEITIVNDSASIARGEHVARAVAKCQECHGENFGGKIHFEQAGFGRITTPNLTMGGVGAKLTGLEWERALRHGVAPDGKALRFMPSEGFTNLSDQEVSDIIAYVRSLPAVTVQPPETSYGWLIRGLYVAGIMPVLAVESIKDHTKHAAPMAVSVTPSYGKHLVDVSGCASCHGEHLSGGPIPGAPSSIPVPRNITADMATGLGKWTLTDFKRAMHEGKRPNGDTINSFMPWKYIGQLHDEELEALWLYLRSVPPMALGNR
jgi:cytochrome c553